MTVELISFTENGGRLADALAAGLERSGHRAACTRKGERGRSGPPPPSAARRP